MLRIAVFSVSAASMALAQNSLTPDEKKAGWILLFDGKSMDGWRPAGAAWTIEDGCLKAQKKPLLTEDLFTKRTFRDFEFSFEWRISPAGNSGIKYRIQKHLYLLPDTDLPKTRFETRVEQSFLKPVTERPVRGQDYVIGFEYQMTDDSTNPDAKGNGKHTAGALYDMVAPASAASRPVGEFNQSRIVVRGNHVEHWLNGVKVVDSSLDSPDALAGIQKRWAASPHVRDLLANQPVKDCPISLQNHGDDAWFRNIKIRELDK
ncbi:MAG: hypothetical protein JWO80_477 [Bryobacterales bacterium]|nr:hypothetical protein [Bryobacterales bacterium]